MQTVLIVLFSLVAALTVSLNTIALSGVINDYLTSAEDERVARDMDLALAIFGLEQDDTNAAARRLSMDARLMESITDAVQGCSAAVGALEQRIAAEIAASGPNGTRLVTVLDAAGNILAGRIAAQGEELPLANTGGNWAALSVVAGVLSARTGQAAVEILPPELLAQVGLDGPARIRPVPAPPAAPDPSDSAEETAGLALTAAWPVRNADGEVVGVVLVAYLLNNDVGLVDRTQAAGGTGTFAVLLGDLRVSATAATDTGNRPIGTRVSGDVHEAVLEQSLSYAGRVRVGDGWLITRCEPLRDHLEQVVGGLCVEAEESAFLGLVQLLSEKAVLIALVPGVLAAILAVPIAAAITRPIAELVDAHRRLAQADMTVRVETFGRGEVAVLGQSFNKMVAMLHKTQQELVHKEKLASMGQLAAGVAHEINNPLGTILLFSEMMLKEAPEGDPRRDDLQMIIGETTRCKNIVSDLLNFARQQEVTAQDTDVHAVLEQVIEAARRQPSFAGIDVVCHFSPDLPTIQADSAQLQQVFINLLNNAAEAIGTEGTITLRTRPVDGPAVEITVSDTGCGIPATDLGKLFTPFFTTKPPGMGTGLGLSIVYGIIKLHRGSITVESQVGEGTSFTVTMPVRFGGAAAEFESSASREVPA